MENEKEECVLCNNALAAFGVLLGLVFLFISIDLLTGNAISSFISGNREEAEE